MTCTPPTEQPASLEDAAERAICWATHSLDLNGRPTLDAIWWLSTHLAASDRVLHGSLRRHREYRDAISAQRRRSRRVQWALWALDRHVTGDARLAGRDIAAVTADLRRAVADYAQAELLLVRAVSRGSDGASRQVLADAYTRAVRRAPTRPHPMLHRARLMRGTVMRAAAAVDHVRDVVDSRHGPLTRRLGTT